MANITIISQPTCEPCQLLKAKLTEHGIPFEVLEWEKNSDNTEVKRLLGAAQYPVSVLSTPTAVIEDENGKLKVLDTTVGEMIETIQTYNTAPLATDTRTGADLPKKETQTPPTTWLGVPRKCYGYGAGALLLVVGLVCLFYYYKPFSSL
jgi:glutaredoxin